MAMGLKREMRRTVAAILLAALLCGGWSGLSGRDATAQEKTSAAEDLEEPATLILHQQQVEPIWDPQGIADFSFTERNGRTVTKKDLLGRPFVAGFIFTRCAGPCPAVTGAMKELQDRFKGTALRLVTITVDPKRDTPDVLRRYADLYRADPEQWLFLTGDQREIYELIGNSFKLPVQEEKGPDVQPGFEILHSVSLMLVNAQGVVIGKYNAQMPDEVSKLSRAVAAELNGAKSARTQSDSSAPAEAGAALNVPAWVRQLPVVNASLNGLATVLLCLGWVLIKIKPRQDTAHKVVMLAAFAVSIIFLGCYLVYHFHQLTKHFEGTGPARWLYFAILISHVLLAITVPFLALTTIVHGLKGRWAKHRRIAKITFPIWLYVSVTGVVIYLMLYHWPVGPAA